MVPFLWKTQKRRCTKSISVVHLILWVRARPPPRRVCPGSAPQEFYSVPSSSAGTLKCNHHHNNNNKSYSIFNTIFATILAQSQSHIKFYLSSHHFNEFNPDRPDPSYHCSSNPSYADLPPFYSIPFSPNFHIIVLLFLLLFSISFNTRILAPQGQGFCCNSVLFTNISHVLNIIWHIVGTQIIAGCRMAKIVEYLSCAEHFT